MACEIYVSKAVLKENNSKKKKRTQQWSRDFCMILFFMLFYAFYFCFFFCYNPYLYNFSPPENTVIPQGPLA